MFNLEIKSIFYGYYAEPQRLCPITLKVWSKKKHSSWNERKNNSFVSSYVHCMLLIITTHLFDSDCGVYVNWDGKRTRQQELMWPAPPIQICMFAIFVAFTRSLVFLFS